VQASSSVTLTVSRGVDYGDNAEVPSVVGMTKDDALTTLGKFIVYPDNRTAEYRRLRGTSYRTGVPETYCGTTTTGTVHDDVHDT